MKKGIITVVLLVITTIAFAQKHNIVNASIALRNENYAEAKTYIDEAYETESTANSPKMWNYRAPIYLQIALKEPALDKDAALKAMEAHIKCLSKDKKGRVVVRKWTSEEDILAGLIQCGYKLFQLKRGNITRETILYNSFFSSNKMKDNTTSKDLLQQLIDINFNEPAIYIHMSNIYLEEDNTEKALEYLAFGRDMFEDDQGLINTEINLYIQLGRTSELIGKLGEAIEIDPDNELLYFNRGTIYDQDGDFINAEKDYKASLEINSDGFGANYNLGALYFNAAIEQNNKANSTSDNSIYKKLKEKAEGLFGKALPYLETAHNLNASDKNTLLSLKQLYYMNGDYSKSEEMKKLIVDLDNKSE